MPHVVCVRQAPPAKLLAGRPSQARTAIAAITAAAIAGTLGLLGCATGDEPTRGSFDETTAGDAAPQGDAATTSKLPSDGGAESATTKDDAAATGPRAPAAGEVFFTEMMINPDGLSDEFGEWVELYNTTDEPLSLEQCHLGDESVPKDDHVIANPIVVPAKTAVVVGRTSKASENGGVSGIVYAYGNAFVLANTGDAAILTCNGVVVDRVAFTSTWPFGKGATMQLRVSYLSASANDAPSAWCTATLSFGSGAQFGTPGNTQNHCP